MRFTLLLIITWLSQTDCKPLHDNHAMESIIRNSLSETMTEKADAIDNLLRLLSDIDLPSICDALSAQQQGGNDKMATVDAILAEAAKSQAMTFIPTNFPEASKVTRPGVAPSDVVSGQKGQRQFEDSKQASQEVVISRSEGKLDGLSLDIASALTREEQPHPNPTKTNNVDISISALSGYRKSIFSSPESTGASMKTTMTASETTMSPPKTTDTPSNKTMIQNKTTMSSPKTTNAPPKTTNAPPKTSMVPTHKTMSPPRTTRAPPKTTPAPAKTTRHPSTSTINTKATKKDTTIPTLASDMMLPDSLFGESGDGENMIEKVNPIETFTTLKMDDETVENKIYNPFEKKYKNIFMDRKIKDYELNKDSPYKLPKSTSSPAPKDAKTSEASEVHSSVYKTFVPDSTNALSEQTTDMIDITPTVEDDLGWGFTLPQNTTFGEFMFGNITLNQTMSDELASILNSTVPVDFLISNDTIYNEFMSILNRTLVTSDSDIPSTPEPEFDMVISETGDIKNLIDYISNMTEKLSTFSPEVNSTTSSPIMNSTTLVDLVTEDLNNSTHIVDSKQIVLNSTLEADYSTYSAKVNSYSNTETSSIDLKATIPTQKDYIHTKFPEYPPRREDKEVKSQTVSRPTAFTAGDYYPQSEAEKVDMLAGSNNFIQHEDIESKFKHSGFAPLNKNHNYKVNARKSGLTYLGFDFKNHHKSPFAPKPLHDQGAVQSLTKQKTIWSEPIKTDVSYPTGYTCPGLFGYFGDAHDCKAFFICSWGVPYRFHCPPGTIWSTAESVCNWSRDVTCSESS